MRHRRNSIAGRARGPAPCARSKSTPATSARECAKSFRPALAAPKNFLPPEKPFPQPRGIYGPSLPFVPQSASPLPVRLGKLSLRASNPMGQQHRLSRLEVGRSNPDRRIDIAFIDMEREQRQTSSLIGAVKLLELLARAPRTDLHRCALRNPPEKIARQVIGRAFDIERKQPKIAAKIPRRLHQVARHPAGQAVLPQDFDFSGLQFRRDVSGGCFHSINLNHIGRLPSSPRPTPKARKSFTIKIQTPARAGVAFWFKDMSFKEGSMPLLATHSPAMHKSLEL